MDSSQDQAATAYLQRIQPRDFTDLAAHVQRDLLALLNTYSSIFDQFENDIKKIQLPDDIATQYQSGIRNSITRADFLLNTTLRELQSIDANLTYNWMLYFINDFRSTIGIFKGWAVLLQDEFKLLPKAQRLKHVEDFSQEMQSIADRMYTITWACADYARTLRDQK